VDSEENVVSICNVRPSARGNYHSKRALGGKVSPNVNVSVIDCGNLNLPEDDGPIAGDRAAHQDQILLGGERSQLVVVQIMDTLPHPGLMFVPIPPRVDYLVFDGVQDVFEGVNGVLMRGVRFVEVELCFGSCKTMTCR
jgi:hypothetical protein